MSPEIKTGKIIIPGRPEEVDLSQVSGDTESGIRFELTGKEDYLNDGDPRSEKIKGVISRGGRVFVTEDDDHLFIETPGKELPEN